MRGLRIAYSRGPRLRQGGSRNRGDGQAGGEALRRPRRAGRGSASRLRRRGGRCSAALVPRRGVARAQLTPAAEGADGPGAASRSPSRARRSRSSSCSTREQKRGALGVHMNQFHETTTCCDADAAARGVRRRQGSRRRDEGEALDRLDAVHLPVQPDAAAGGDDSLRPDQGGLPVGLHIVGPRYADALVLRAARAFESVQPIPMPRRLDARARRTSVVSAFRACEQNSVWWSASLSPSARWESGELRGLAGAPEAAGERRGSAESLALLRSG